MAAIGTFILQVIPCRDVGKQSPSRIAIDHKQHQNPPVSQPYRSLEAELHDAFWDAEDDRSELPLMADFLEQHAGKALEIGSGSGRLMLPLIQQGFDLEGLELSPDMRAIAQRQAREMGIEAVTHAGDMSDWQAPHRYSAILAPAFTLQLATDPATTLRHWHELLVPDGGLYLTTFIPYAELMGEIPENEWYPDHQATLADGRVAILKTRHSIDRTQQRLNRQHRYSIQGDTAAYHECQQTLHWFEHGQMLALLESTGFKTDRHFLDFDQDHDEAMPTAEDFDGIVTYLARRPHVK